MNKQDAAEKLAELEAKVDELKEIIDKPGEIYVHSCPKSIGDMGFTRIDMREGHCKYHHDDVLREKNKRIAELEDALETCLKEIKSLDCDMVDFERDFENEIQALNKGGE